jgi:hypothetical protein
MNQYVVQNYNQIIDLYEKIDGNNALAVKCKTTAPFEYALISEEHLNSIDFSTLALTTSTSGFEKVINNSQRYLVVKSDSLPSPVISITRVITTKIAELFSFSHSDPQYFWFVMILVALSAVAMAAASAFLLRNTPKITSPANIFNNARKNNSSFLTAANDSKNAVRKTFAEYKEALKKL